MNIGIRAALARCRADCPTRKSIKASLLRAARRRGVSDLPNTLGACVDAQ
jgi:hypothetical protein